MKTMEMATATTSREPRFDFRLGGWECPPGWQHPKCGHCDHLCYADRPVPAADWPPIRSICAQCLRQRMAGWLTF